MVTRYWQLDAYKLAKEGRKRIFELSKTFPKELGLSAEGVSKPNVLIDRSNQEIITLRL